MDTRFDGKRALVTGAGRGIGRGIAIKLAELGAKVVAVARTQEDLDSLQKKAPGTEVHSIDLTDWDATRTLVESLGPIDLLVNNAGVTVISPFLDVKKDDVDMLFDLNFKAAYNISQTVAKGMVERGKGGSIVMMSSVASLKGYGDWSVYCCSKAALDQLTRCLALELGKYKIRVNALNPTVVMTSLARQAGWDKPDIAKPYLDRIPLGHFAEIDDVVNATLYLLSDKAAMINGIIMPLDGGLTTQL